MSNGIAGALVEAWALAKADRDILIRIAGPFFFLPLLAVLLLIPPMPPLSVDDTLTAEQQRAAMQPAVEWMTGYAGPYLLASVVVQFGGLVVLMLYLCDDRPDVGAALARAMRLFPRYLPLMIVAGLPLGLGQLYILLLLPGLYLFGRMIAAGPALVAEPPPGIRKAIRRSWSLTRGHGLMTAGLAGLSVLGGGLAALPFVALDQSLRKSGLGNPVALALVDGAAAAATTAALLAMALIQVALYRRLVSSKGI